SPAAAAGLRAGDQLVTVAGRAVAGLPVTEVTSRLRGPDGSRVEVTVRHESAGSPVTMSVTRRTMSTHDVEVVRLEHHVLGIKVAMFSRGVGDAVATALRTR